MARGSAPATAAATTAANTNTGLQGNANALYSTLAPTLETEIATPAGFGPTTTAAMNTAAEQGAGGTQAGAVGQGGLLAARTRNSGAPAAAIAQSSEKAGQQLSEGELQTQLANEALKQKQQQSGISGMEGLTQDEQADALSALGQVAPDVNANTGATNASWDWATDLLDPALSAAGNSAGLIAKSLNSSSGGSGGSGGVQ